MVVGRKWRVVVDRIGEGIEEGLLHQELLSTATELNGFLGIGIWDLARGWGPVEGYDGLD